MSNNNAEIHIDTLFAILEFLSIADGLSLLCTCKNWYELDRFEIVWKTLLSNFIQTKIDYYGKLNHSDDGDENDLMMVMGHERKKKGGNLYKSIISQLNKFYESQIVKEKSVSRASFEKYMDEDRYGEKGEKSTVFGMRFKKLASSAMIMHYNMKMAKGVDEIRHDFTKGVVNYEHSGYMAQYFLNQAKKFTLNGRVNNSLYAQEYWKRFTFSIADVMSGEIGKTDDDCSPQVICFVQNFKPILNDKILEKILISYWNVNEDENGNESFLDFLLNYIAVEGNYEKSEDPYIDFMQLTRTKRMVRLRYLKKMFNAIYPNQWLDNFQTCFEWHFRYQKDKYFMEFFSPDSCETPEEVVNSLCQFLEVFEEKSIDYSRVKSHSLFLYGYEREIIDLLSERGMITPIDLKIIFHRFNYRSKISHLLSKIENFDPYEISPETGNTNFILSYFRNYCKSSPNQFFKPFFEMYPAKYDLNILFNNYKGITLEFLKEINSKMLTCFVDYYGFDDVMESFKLMIDNFSPSIDVECIEKIADFFNPYTTGSLGYAGLTNPHMLDGFKYALEHIQYNGMPFAQYCQTIRHKYSTEETNFQSFFGEEKMAYLYNQCLAIIELMPQFFVEKNKFK